MLKWTSYLAIGAIAACVVTAASSASAQTAIPQPAIVDPFAPTAAEENTHDGKVVRIEDGELVMTDLEDAEHTHTFAEGAKLSLDGKECKVADLKPGMRVRVTTQEGDDSIAEEVEGIDKNKDFAIAAKEGKLFSVNAQSLVMTDNRGQRRFSCPVADAVKVTCDGKECKWSDLKIGASIRVTCQEKSPHAATKIEAIDKNLKFTSL